MESPCEEIWGQCGLKIGTRGLLSVLTTSQGAVMRSEKGRQVFATYYNKTGSQYGKIIKPFGVPKAFGSRHRIIEGILKTHTLVSWQDGVCKRVSDYRRREMTRICFAINVEHR